MLTEPTMKGQLADAGIAAKGRRGKATTPVMSTTMATASCRSPPILTNAFQQACRIAASSTRMSMNTGDVMTWMPGLGLGRSGGIGPLGEALKDAAAGVFGQGHDHAVEAPGLGRVNQEVIKPVIEIRVVAPGRKPADQPARRLTVVGEGPVHGDQQGWRIGPAEQPFGPFQDVEFVACHVDVDEGAGAVRQNLVDLDAGDAQQVASARPVAPRRNAAAPRKALSVDEGVDHRPAADEPG